MVNLSTSDGDLDKPESKETKYTAVGSKSHFFIGKTTTRKFHDRFRETLRYSANSNTTKNTKKCKHEFSLTQLRLNSPSGFHKSFSTFFTNFKKLLDYLSSF